MVSSSSVVAPMTAKHAEQVLAIYQDGIAEGNATRDGARHGPAGVVEHSVCVREHH